MFTTTSRMRWKKISPLPAQCGEKKFFTATSRMRWKKFFTAKIANLTNIHRANFNAYLIFTGNIIEVSDRWRSGLRSWWHAWGRGSNHGSFVFVRIPVNAVKKKFSTQNSTQFLQKFTAFSAFNAKRCGRFAVKNVIFCQNLDPGLTFYKDRFWRGNSVNFSKVKFFFTAIHR